MATQSKSDKNSDYMYSLWSNDVKEEKKVIQEIMHDEIEKNKHKLSEVKHKQIRNDEDYDDWTYGTEPTYGSSW